MRPALTKDIRLIDFKNYYWLKEELQAFCKSMAISTTGSKMELTKRIEVFLETGDIPKPSKNSRTSKSKQNNEPLSLQTVITDDHRYSQEVRYFFKTVIGPKFHFSTTIQNYFKSNVGKTYEDVVKAWHEEQEHKKDPSNIKELAPQFEYNQFIRDYFSDPHNKDKNRQEAIESWNQIKKLPGSNKYIPVSQEDCSLE